MSQSRTSIVFGAFKGMGDLLCAAPVILSELRRGIDVHLLLFPNDTLHEFCHLIDFSPHQQNLFLHSIPTSSDLGHWKKFLCEMKSITPEIVWISPHAPAADSSWKIPLVLRIIQLLFWKKTQLVCADTERLSSLMHRRLPADRSLPLRQREWSTYRLLRGSDLPEQPVNIRFVSKITDRRQVPHNYDLVIHPGANAKNRSWPLYKYAPLVSNLPRQWRIAILGLPSDLTPLKQIMPRDRAVEYVTGSIGDSIATLASANILLIMDSGNMHFAQVLGVPAVAVFGYTNPADIIDLRGCVDAVYEQRFPCQPCRKAVCSQPEIYCLNSVEPKIVADRLIAQWERLGNALNSPANFITLR